MNTLVPPAGLPPAHPERARVERFRSFYDANYDDLWRYCLRRAPTAAEAEDILGETFAVAWRKLDAVPTGAGARPWLFGVARNHLRNHSRKRKRSRDLTQRVASTVPLAAADDPATLAVDDSASVLRALKELKEADQELLRLVAWEELSHAEIATVLECSENAVGIRLHRARHRLTEELEKARKTPSAQDTLSVEATGQSPGDGSKQTTQKGSSHE